MNVLMSAKNKQLFSGFSPIEKHLKKATFPRDASVGLELYSSHVQAGFPSPSDDYVESLLDLNEHLIHHPA
jgi:DNA polymerase V